MIPLRCTLIVWPNCPRRLTHWPLMVEKYKSTVLTDGFDKKSIDEQQSQNFKLLFVFLHKQIYWWCLWCCTYTESLPGPIPCPSRTSNQSRQFQGTSPGLWLFNCISFWYWIVGASYIFSYILQFREHLLSREKCPGVEGCSWLKDCSGKWKQLKIAILIWSL